MQLNAKINSDDLRSILKSLSIVSYEGMLSFTQNEMTSKLVDPANVCMVDLNIPTGEFTDYELDEDFSIELDYDKTLNFISDAKNEVVSLGITKTHIEINYGIAQFRQATVALDSLRSEPKLPILSFNVKLELKTKQVSKAIKSCGKLADHITFQMLKDDFSIHGKGNTDEVTAEIEDPLIHKADTAISIYSVDYLTDLFKGIGTTETITLEMSTGFPLVITTTTKKTGTLMYLLAPRIEAD